MGIVDAVRQLAEAKLRRDNARTHTQLVAVRTSDELIERAILAEREAEAGLEAAILAVIEASAECVPAPLLTPYVVKGDLP